MSGDVLTTTMTQTFDLAMTVPRRDTRAIPRMNARRAKLKMVQSNVNLCRRSISIENFIIAKCEYYRSAIVLVEGGKDSCRDER